jgi:hypothetical protein
MALKESQWAQKATKPKPKALTPEQQAQEQARAGNAQAVKNPNTISSVPKPVSPLTPEQHAQEQARAGNAAKVNGGKQVGNTNRDVANARPGDFIQRSNGTIYVLKAGDIAWAKKKVGSKDMPKTTPPKKPMSGKPGIAPAETGPIGELKNPKTNTAIEYEIEQAKKETPYSQITTRDFKKAVQSGAIRVPRNIIDIVNKGV